MSGMIERVARLIHDHRRQARTAVGPTRILLTSLQLAQFTAELELTTMLPIGGMSSAPGKRRFMGVDIRSIEEV